MAEETWQGPLDAVRGVQPPPARYANTTFRDGIEDTFAVGNHLSAQGHYPLYVSWEDYSAGVTNVILSASSDGGQTWSAPIQVNDNAGAVDEFQPNLRSPPTARSATRSTIGASAARPQNQRRHRVPDSPSTRSIRRSGLSLRDHYR